MSCAPVKEGVRLDEANLLRALDDRRMEHVGHPRAHIGIGA
jgi:hypothetical protein